MFHLSTVERNTLQTLEEIFVLPEIGQHFALAGGTSLALQIGHRMSVDLDIFSGKYGDTQFYYLWRSIQYFEDAEDDPDIIGFQQFNVTWEQIKEEVSRKCV